jgi:hypothetical protein
MSRKTILPALEIFVDDYHGILELGATHRTCDRHVGILLMFGPDFEAFCMKALFANFTSGIAFPIHFLITNWAH